MPEPPLATVIIPTYNRRDHLNRTLRRLTHQTLPADRFEVVVADDGSTDDSRELAESYGPRLRIRYCFQPDEGFRAGAARNMGAALAESPTLIMLDCGTIPGPGFVAGHLAAQGETGRAVIGYTHGYGLAPILDQGDADSYDRPEMLEALRADPAWRDCRHQWYADVDFAIEDTHTPWQMFWSANVSLPARVYRDLGGFDEEYRSYGMEDLDLGYRVFRTGLPFTVSRDAWAFEFPHSRDNVGSLASNRRNQRRFAGKFRDPAVEIGAVLIAGRLPESLEAHMTTLLDWTETARGMSAEKEIETALAATDPQPGDRTAVFGCGTTIPTHLHDTALLDFDPQAATTATANPTNDFYHSLGINTGLLTHEFELVIITSRLRGIWNVIGRHVLAEAHRVGRRVWISPDLAPQAS
jgi:validoxylamine A glucosyltransferase